MTKHICTNGLSKIHVTLKGGLVKRHFVTEGRCRDHGLRHTFLFFSIHTNAEIIFSAAIFTLCDDVRIQQMSFL